MKLMKLPKTLVLVVAWLVGAMLLSLSLLSVGTYALSQSGSRKL